jgi:hypothetical protein
MPTHKNFIMVLLISLAMLATTTALAQSSKPAVSLDEAVLGVQHDTGGRVLSAEPHSIGHKLKYIIKVLTPDGHVRKVVVSSEASENPVSGQSTKHPSGKRAGGKEKH